ncbi:MAG: hypothetical protein R2732_09790 [Microbacteriaceae bacterium]
MSIVAFGYLFEAFDYTTNNYCCDFGNKGAFLRSDRVVGDGRFGVSRAGGILHILQQASVTNRTMRFLGLTAGEKRRTLATHAVPSAQTPRGAPRAIHLDKGVSIT